MKKIELTQGQKAVVDDSDYDFLSRHKWSAIKIHRVWYAVRSANNKGRKQFIYMHHLLIELPTDASERMVRDHIDGNGLNNCRSNLRVITNRQNVMKSRMRTDNKTGFRNIHFDKATGKYRATLRRNGKSINFPRRDTLQEALEMLKSSYDIGRPMEGVQ